MSLQDMIAAKHAAELEIRARFHRRYCSFWKCPECGAYLASGPALCGATHAPCAAAPAGYGWEIADVSKIIAAEEVLERLACAQLAAQPAPCDACKRRPGEQNHPAGMIFVGWGRGWEVCGECNGTQVK